jgi:hypothetical protein
MASMVDPEPVEDFRARIELEHLRGTGGWTSEKINAAVEAFVQTLAHRNPEVPHG